LYPYIQKTLLLQLFVNDVLSKAGSGPLEFGEEVAELLDTLHLLLEVLSLEEVGELVVVVVVGDGVQVQKALVDGLLESEGGLDGLDGAAPLVLLGPFDVLEDDAAAASVLVLDELFGVLALLVGSLEEEFGKSGQGYVVAVKVGGLCEIKEI
jgi:hypothetical protein